MTITWEDVTKLEGYKNASPQKIEESKKLYFDEYIAPLLLEPEKSRLRDAFIGKSVVGQSEKIEPQQFHIFEDIPKELLIVQFWLVFIILVLLIAKTPFFLKLIWQKLFLPPINHIRTFIKPSVNSILSWSGFVKISAKFTLLTTASVLLIMLLFPPYKVVTNRFSGGVGYAFILEPPKGISDHLNAIIDTDVLLAQCVVVALAGGFIWLALKK